MSRATPLLSQNVFTANTGKNVASYLLLIMASTLREGWKSKSSGISCHQKQLQGVYREAEKCLRHSESVTQLSHKYASDESLLSYLLSTLLS
jgi:hypothetical protein